MPRGTVKAGKTPVQPARAPATTAHKTQAVPSAIGSLFQALKTARLEVPDEQSPSSPQRAARQDDLVHHLATMLHGAYLVTLVERAQLGTPVLETSGQSADTQATVPEAAVHPVASTTVDARWLSAIIQYCRFTVVLDDLAKLAEAFPAHVSVRWSVKASTGPVSTTLAAILDDQASAMTLPCVAPSAERKRPRRGTTPHARGDPSLTDGALVARLSVHQSTVPSIEEATRILEDTLRSKGAPAAQRAWRTHLSQLTAYHAFLQQHPLSPSSGAESTAVPASEDVGTTTTAATSSSPTNGDRDMVAHRTQQELSAEERALLTQLSPDLRNALSHEKLRGVLNEMKRERDRADSKADAEIHKRQVQERLLVTYEHILALCGPKRRTFGASQLLHKLEAESPFAEHRNVQAQLGILLGLNKSGITASTVNAEGTVVPVGNLAVLSSEALDSVLIAVDPESCSVKGILESLAN